MTQKIKMTALICMIIMCSIMMMACSKKSYESDNTTIPKKDTKGYTNGYIFSVSDVDIVLYADMSAIEKKLGSPKKYAEVKSCAFDGQAGTYYYGAYTVHTEEIDEIRRIYSIVLNNDLVATREGLAIGMGEDKVISIYGDADTVAGVRTYKKGNTGIIVAVENNIVVSIEYMVYN